MSIIIVFYMMMEAEPASEMCFNLKKDMKVADKSGTSHLSNTFTNF